MNLSRIALGATRPALALRCAIAAGVVYLLARDAARELAEAVA